MITYEELLRKTVALPPPLQNNSRTFMPCDEFGVISIAKNLNGQIEIFLVGEKLSANMRRVRDAIEYQRWFREGGSEFSANRILLPSYGHFEHIAAFLCIELIREGAGTDLQTAFAKTEPLIELAISDLLMASESLLGLCGEMLTLRSLVLASDSQGVLKVVEGWKGFGQTSRDFQIQNVGVEVKTTTSKSSSHLFSGVHQVQVGYGVDGVEETDFFVVSVGLEWADDNEVEGTTSLPEIVDDVILKIVDSCGDVSSGPVDELVRNISSYGKSTQFGYDHNGMGENSRFARRFRTNFVRGYDMRDPAINLFTDDDIRRRPFIDGQTLSFRVNFPDKVTGDINPIVGFNKIAQRVLGRRL